MALAAILAAAPGDLYRCKDERGGLTYQDQPCRSGEQSVLRGKSTRHGQVLPGERRLREWLSRQPPAEQKTAGTAIKAPPPGGVVSQLSPRPPAGEQQLAACSDQFLQCARDPALLDACVATIPECGSAPRSCCHRAFVHRYQKLRAAGAGQPHAIREALLGQ